MSRDGGTRRIAARSWKAVVAVAGALGIVASLAVTASSSPTAPAAPTSGCSTAATLRSDPRGVDGIEHEAQQAFYADLNDLRRAKGLGALAWNEAMAGPSISWSQTMSSQVPPGGSSPGWLHHARDTGGNDGVSWEQDYVNINSRIVANWSRLAENVGVGGMRESCSMTDLRTNTSRVVVALHDAFVASAGHYKNMVGDHNQVAVGVHIDADQLWVTVRFAKGDLPAPAPATVTPQVAKYLDAVHVLFLGRRATTSEKQRWAGSVSAGRRSDVTGALAVSDEWAGVRVNDLYRTVLGRNADASGRRFWVDQIARGMTIEFAAANMYGSPEYFTRSGGTNRRFVAALYRDILGRTADRGGLDNWAGLLDRGVLRPNDVAANFYASIESRRTRVIGLYEEILDREPDRSGREYWAGQLLGLGDVVLAAELASSAEFMQRAVA